MMKTGKLSDDQKASIAAGEAEEPKVLGLMEKAMELRGHKFVGGDSINIADIQIFCELKKMDYMSRSWAVYPLISKWHDEVRQAKGIKEVHDEWEKTVLPAAQKMFADVNAASV